MTSRDSD